MANLSTPFRNFTKHYLLVITLNQKFLTGSRTTLTLSLCFLVGLSIINSASGVEKININTASLKDLIKIIHIGEVRAKELISLRPFSSLDDLVRIKGINKERVKDIKKQGLAWVEIENNLNTEAPKLIVYPKGVVFNEILPSPEGPDNENEWIEIFNQNSFQVDLSDWQIADTIGKITVYSFPKKSIIRAGDFLVLPRPMTKITLNNTGDGLKLIQPDKRIIDSVNYKKAPRGKSFNRIKERWIWSSDLTPGSANTILEMADKTKKGFRTEVKKEVENNKEKNLATVKEATGKIKIKQNLKSFSSFFVALTLAVFSGIIILNLKKKLNQSQ